MLFMKYLNLWLKTDFTVMFLSFQDCFALNRTHPDPFYLHFCNVEREGTLMRKLNRFIPTLYDVSTLFSFVLLNHILIRC